MKYIILFLIATLANADVYIKRQTSEQLGNGYMFAFPQGEVVICLGIPDVLDVMLVPNTWMRVTDAAEMYNWPFMTDAAAEACANPPPIPRTKGGAFYTVGSRMQIEQIGTIPAGVPCGDKIMWLNYFRAVFYNGQYGFAACT